MKQYLSVLSRTILFDGLTTEEMERMIHCLGCYRRQYAVDSIILEEGTPTNNAGIILSGVAIGHWLRADGEMDVQAIFEQGDMFGDILMAGPQSLSPIQITAKKECEILFVPYMPIMQSCAENCDSHIKLRMNYLRWISEKFMRLTERVQYLSQKSLRARILLFLQQQKMRSGQSKFQIPYNREEMAAVLGANRSALSKELAKMQKEGILTYHKNSFQLLLDATQKNCGSLIDI